MTYALTLLRKLGLFAPKAEPADDFFVHRLTRIGSRDARREVRATLFLRTPA